MPLLLDTPDDGNGRRGLLRLVKEASGSRKRGLQGQQICVSSASDGQDKADFFCGRSAAESIVVDTVQPARAGHFLLAEEARDDGHLAQFLVVCQESRR